jgi:hypothetical protein
MPIFGNAVCAVCQWPNYPEVFLATTSDGAVAGIAAAAGCNAVATTRAKYIPWYSGLVKREYRLPLSSLRHHYPKNVIDAGGIAGTILLKPLEYVGIQTHGHQFFGRTAELAELLIGELGDIGIVELRNVSAFLPPGNAV